LSPELIRVRSAEASTPRTRRLDTDKNVGATKHRHGQSVIPVGLEHAMRKWIYLTFSAMFLLLCWHRSTASAAQWQAGAAEVKITPTQPMWMSGYASRTKPAESTLSDLWAKALVLDDGQGHRAVLVTFDLVGISRQLSLDVRRQIAEKHKLDPASIVLCASHTHSGPVVGANLTSMWNLDAAQQKLVDEYAVELPNKLAVLADEAFSRLTPATLEWGIGSATFAVNRRNNKELQVPTLIANHALNGPVDHDLPVLAVKNMEDRLLAIAFGPATRPLSAATSGAAIGPDLPSPILKRRIRELLPCFGRGAAEIKTRCHATPSRSRKLMVVRQPQVLMP
jgi:hypothetical protein